MRYTKGPWTVEFGTENNPSCIIQSEKTYIAQTVGGNDEANARLIAAAPDLFECLRTLVKQEKDVIFDYFTVQHRDARKSVIEQARTLIEKVER